MSLNAMIDEYMEILSGFYGYKDTETFETNKPQVKRSFEKIMNDENLNNILKEKMINTYFRTVRNLSFNM